MRQMHIKFYSLIKWKSNAVTYDHTALRARHPVRSGKLNNAGPPWCLERRRLGNRGCRKHFFDFFKCNIVKRFPPVIKKCTWKSKIYPRPKKSSGLQIFNLYIFWVKWHNSLKNKYESIFLVYVPQFNYKCMNVYALVDIT